MRIHMGTFSSIFVHQLSNLQFLTSTRFALCPTRFANGYGYLWVFMGVKKNNKSATSLRGTMQPLRER